MTDLTNPKLTGNRRHRLHRTPFGRQFLVLQVEERGMRTRFIAGDVDTDFCSAWRDATPEDLMTEAHAR